MAQEGLLMEKKLEFVKRFISGDQNINYSESYGITERMKQYWWQEDLCFNLFVDLRKELSSLTDEAEEVSIVMELVPYQYIYNRLMNIVLELSAKLVCPVVTVEDGSVDVDGIEEGGLCPGKIIIYRQGSNSPISIYDVKPESISVVAEQARTIKQEFYEKAEVLFSEAVSNKGKGLKVR